MRDQVEDRKASLMAAAMGVAAVGGFWLARPGRAPVALTLVEQRNLPLAALDRDAAAAFRVEFPRVVHEAMEDNLPVVFRIVDGEGRVYPLANMHDAGGDLKLPLGYPTDPVEPRLEAAVEGRPLAFVALNRLPPPVQVPLVATPDVPFRLVWRGDPWLDVEAKAAIPRGERWRIVARRTRFAPQIEAAADLPSARRRFPSHRLAVPFAGGAELVEADLARYRAERVSTVLRLSGLRLVRRFGGTCLVVDGTKTFENALGARIVLPRQRFGPYRPLRHPDPRAVTVSLSLFPPWAKDAPRPFLDPRERPPEIEILSPAPESLGLRAIRIGAGIRSAPSPNVGPLREGPFEATVRVTFLKPVLIDRQTYVAPVEAGTPKG